MLQSLHISNYALIDQLDIAFQPGFNIITGETGAGKSIMLGALSLILGGRADTKVVRDKDRKSVIEATFEVSDYSSLKAYCQANDVEWDDGSAYCAVRSLRLDVPGHLSMIRQSLSCSSKLLAVS